MRRSRFICFDALEERKLLSGARHVTAHAKPAVGTTPLVLNGTLTVVNTDQTTTEDEDGDVTTSTPVVGQLGILGKVHGIWNESADEFGGYEGPDTIQLRTAKGTFIVAFSEQNTSSVHHLAGARSSTFAPSLPLTGPERSPEKRRAERSRRPATRPGRPS